MYFTRLFKIENYWKIYNLKPFNLTIEIEKIFKLARSWIWVLWMNKIWLEDETSLKTTNMILYELVINKVRTTKVATA
jgi:hypothetical protein